MNFYDSDLIHTEYFDNENSKSLIRERLEREGYSLRKDKKGILVDYGGINFARLIHMIDENFLIYLNYSSEDIFEFKTDLYGIKASLVSIRERLREILSNEEGIVLVNRNSD